MATDLANNTCCGLAADYNFCAKCGKQLKITFESEIQRSRKLVYMPKCTARGDLDYYKNTRIDYALYNPYYYINDNELVHTIKFKGLFEFVCRKAKINASKVSFVPYFVHNSTNQDELFKTEVFVSGIAKDIPLCDLKKDTKLSLLALTRTELEEEFPFLAGLSLEEFRIDYDQVTHIGENVFDLALLFAVYNNDIVSHYLRKK